MTSILVSPSLLYSQNICVSAASCNMRSTLPWQSSMSAATHLSHFCSTTTSRISLPHRISCKHQLTLSVSATAHHSTLFHTIATLILQQELRLHHSHFKSNATSLFPRVAQLIILSHINMRIYIVTLKLFPSHITITSTAGTQSPSLVRLQYSASTTFFSRVAYAASTQDSPNLTTNGSSLSHLLL